jgi:spore coat protein U-like protein
MKVHRHLAASVVAMCAGLAAPAQAALLCSAAIDPLVLGQVSLRDGFGNSTFGTALVSCSGGEPGATVQTCLQIGAGSGGASSGLSPRFLQGVQMDRLDYQLTQGAAASAGGQLIDRLERDLVLDAAGGGTVDPLIYAEITDSGATAPAGSYISQFTGAADVAFSYGQGGCTQSGDVNGFAVSATVTASCTVSANPMNFGLSTGTIIDPIDSAAILSVSCTNGAAYSIGLDGGQSPTASGRTMTNSAAGLSYGLFHDTGLSAPWGLISGTTATGYGSGKTDTLPIYGRVFGGQHAATGLYSDAVVIVITY